MKKIPADFVEINFSPADFLTNCDEAFLMYGRGVFSMPVREEKVHPDGRFTLKMPAVIPGYAGYKFIEELPSPEPGKLGRRTAVIRLKPEGEEEVEMDAEHITNMRTGAAGALGLKYFRPDAKNVAIIGTGKISKALALCAAELGIKTINVYSRNPENRDKFKTDLNELGAEIRLHDTVASAVKNAEAVLTAVPTPVPVIFYGDLPWPVLVSVMGGDSRTAQLDPEILRKALVVPDNLEQCKKSGEFKAAFAEGYFDKINFARRGDRAANIGDAASGLVKPGPEITVAYFTGLAVQDVNAAKMIYKKFADKR